MRAKQTRPSLRRIMEIVVLSARTELGDTQHHHSHYRRRPAGCPELRQICIAATCCAAYHLQIRLCTDSPTGLFWAQKKSVYSVTTSPLSLMRGQKTTARRETVQGSRKRACASEGCDSNRCRMAPESLHMTQRASAGTRLPSEKSNCAATCFSQFRCGLESRAAARETVRGGRPLTMGDSHLMKRRCRPSCQARTCTVRLGDNRGPSRHSPGLSQAADTSCKLRCTRIPACFSFIFTPTACYVLAGLWVKCRPASSTQPAPTLCSG